MHNNTLFEKFEHGRLGGSSPEKQFSELPWNNHPSFTGVALKHLTTGKDSDGLFSYHLVRIEPGCAIGEHTHDPQLETHEVIDGAGICRNGGTTVDYFPGVISIFRPRICHSVEAGKDGLLIFAKFMPPLC